MRLLTFSFYPIGFSVCFFIVQLDNDPDLTSGCIMTQGTFSILQRIVYITCEIGIGSLYFFLLNSCLFCSLPLISLNATKIVRFLEYFISHQNPIQKIVLTLRTPVRRQSERVDKSTHYEISFTNGGVHGAGRNSNMS